jgi:hypothetical protein
MDFRRSGAVEALAGGVAPETLAAKMANSIDRNCELQKTYRIRSPSYGSRDDARAKGRQRMGGNKQVRGWSGIAAHFGVESQPGPATGWED